MKAFTLIEILVVILIIGLLLAVLFPVLSMARRKSYQSACLSNMQQLGMASKMYILDNDNIYPGEEVWVVGDLIKSKLSCTSVEGDEDSQSNSVIGYGYNFNLCESKGVGVHESKISWPSMAIAFAEVDKMKRPVVIGPYQSENIDVEYYRYLKNKPYSRHSGGANYLFCDGHAQWLRLEQLDTPGFPPHETLDSDGSKPTFDLFK